MPAADTMVLPRKVDVSVIMPAYRALSTIGRAIASVARQSVRPREIIVVIDGMDDDERTAIEAYREVFDDLIVLQRPKRGAGAARNHGIRVARSTFLAFLDADDEWLPEKLERSLVELNRGFILVAHDYDLIARAEIRRVNCASIYATARDRFDMLYRKGYIATSSVVCRREDVLTCGGFDEELPVAQDFDLWLRMLADPSRDFLVFPEALTRYHVVAGSITTNRERRLRCTIEIAIRHIPTLQRRSLMAWNSLAYRLLAVHYEAIHAYARQSRWFSAAKIAALFPINFLHAFVRFGTAAPRSSETRRRDRSG